MELPARFRFTDVLRPDVEPASHLVRIGSGLRRKRELFARYDRALRLPDYFGWNWDALEECLDDLSWLAAPRRVAITHEDLPFRPQGRNRRIYLSLLRDVVARNRAVTVLFPQAVQAEVLRAVANLAREE